MMDEFYALIVDSPPWTTLIMPCMPKIPQVTLPNP
jgi:hypothetical protein